MIKDFKVWSVTVESGNFAIFNIANAVPGLHFFCLFILLSLLPVF